MSIPKRKPKHGPALDYVRPQLYEPVAKPPEGREWVHELKLDGYRMQIHVSRAKRLSTVAMASDWTERFPEIAKACEGLDDCIIDGEVCAVDKAGVPSIAGLTDALTAKKTAALVYYVFDLIVSRGASLMSQALSERKAVLKKDIPKLGRADRKTSLCRSQVRRRRGRAQGGCELKLEGIVSKRIDAAYKPDDRSGIWTKAKCRLSQELVMGGRPPFCQRAAVFS